MGARDVSVAFIRSRTRRTRRVSRRRIRFRCGPMRSSRTCWKARSAYRSVSSSIRRIPRIAGKRRPTPRRGSTRWSARSTAARGNRRSARPTNATCDQPNRRSQTMNKRQDYDEEILIRGIQTNMTANTTTVIAVLAPVTRAVEQQRATRNEVLRENGIRHVERFENIKSGFLDASILLAARLIISFDCPVGFVDSLHS